MVGYTIHYTDNDDTESTNADTISVDISGLSDYVLYTITVEARSDHLSGESEPMNITSTSTSLCMYSPHVLHNIKGIILYLQS